MNVTVLRLSEREEVLHVIEYIIFFHLWACHKSERYQTPFISAQDWIRTRVQKQHKTESKGHKSIGKGGGYGFIDLSLLEQKQECHGL